jgi:hypothetical protein
MAKNEDCSVSDSVLCKWLDKDCKDCYIHTLKKSDEPKEMLENFQVTLELLPKGFDELQGEKCCFCKGEHKNERAGYAIVDLAHSEPAHMKGMFFGFGKKVRQRIGSMMPVSISICGRCRASFRLAEAFKWLGIVVLGGISVGLLVVPSIGQAVSNVSPALPIGVVLVAAAAGYFLGKLASAAYVKASSERMAFNVFDIPVVGEMKRRGWFTIQDDGDVTRVLFSHKPFTRKLADIGYTPSGEVVPEERPETD